MTLCPLSVIITRLCITDKKSRTEGSIERAYQFPSFRFNMAGQMISKYKSVMKTLQVSSGKYERCFTIQNERLSVMSTVCIRTLQMPWNMSNLFWGKRSLLLNTSTPAKKMFFTRLKCPLELLYYGYFSIRKLKTNMGVFFSDHD